MSEIPHARFVCPEEGRADCSVGIVRPQMPAIAIPQAGTQQGETQYADTFIPDPVYISEAHVLIHENSRVFLLRDFDGQLILPGGVIKPRENLGRAVTRITKHDAGLDIRVASKFKAFQELIAPDNNGHPVHHTAVVAKARYSGGTVEYDPESYADAMWVKQTTLPRLAEIACSTRRAFAAMKLGRLLED